jgi:chromosome segregation ATPase
MCSIDGMSRSLMDAESMTADLRGQIDVLAAQLGASQHQIAALQALQKSQHDDALLSRESLQSFRASVEKERELYTTSAARIAELTLRNTELLEDISRMTDRLRAVETELKLFQDGSESDRERHIREKERERDNENLEAEVSRLRLELLVRDEQILERERVRDSAKGRVAALEQKIEHLESEMARVATADNAKVILIVLV